MTGQATLDSIGFSLAASQELTLPPFWRYRKNMTEVIQGKSRFVHDLG